MMSSIGYRLDKRKEKEKTSTDMKLRFSERRALKAGEHVAKFPEKKCNSEKKRLEETFF